MNATPIRPWTPDQIVVDRRSGDRGTRLSPKRMCNRCGLKLGDPTELEMLDAVRGWPDRDVDRSCPHCAGVHVLIALPATRQPGHDPEDDEIEQYVVVCPDREDPQRDCFVYDRCGCTPPDGFDPLTEQGQAWLEQPCPHSPTGEHWYEGEIDEVVCPVAGSCFHADHCDDLDNLAWETVGFTPGVYALDVRFDDGGNPVWEAVTVDEARSRQAARRDAKAEHAAS